MKATDVLKNWKTFSGFIYERVIGDNTVEITDDEWEKIDEKSLSVIKNLGIDEKAVLARKLNNLNFLDKKVSFKIFEKLPNAWKAIFNTCIDIVAVETGQSVMARRIG